MISNFAKKEISAYWGKIGEKCQKRVVWSKNAKKGRKMAETPPKFFWRQIRFESTPEKMPLLRPFLIIGGRYLAENVKKRGFW